MLQAKIAGKSHIVEPGETTIEIKEMLSESEKLMSECTMTWEQKEKQTEKIQQVWNVWIYMYLMLIKTSFFQWKVFFEEGTLSETNLYSPYSNCNNSL